MRGNSLTRLIKSARGRDRKDQHSGKRFYSTEIYQGATNISLLPHTPILYNHLYLLKIVSSKDCSVETEKRLFCS